MRENAAYYYNLLSKEDKKVYYAMYEGLSRLEPEFQVPKIEGRQLAEIYFSVRMDHPEIFYTVSFSYKFYMESDKLILTPEYIFPKNKIKEHQQAMKSRIAKLARQAEKKSEEEKLKYVHDFICTNIHYDKLKKPYSHEIIGALGHGVAVCEGISKAVKVLCDALDLWCIVALSGANPDKKIKYRHAWNVVKVGGRYYHLDATFDNTLGAGKNIRYDYYKLGDRQIFRDHEPVLYKIPECSDCTHSYYQEKKLSFTKMEDLTKRLQQPAKKGREFLFQWRGSYLTREVLSEILELCVRAGENYGKSALVSINYPQAVFTVNFKPKETEDMAANLQYEEADEMQMTENINGGDV